MTHAAAVHSAATTTTAPPQQQVKESEPEEGAEGAAAMGVEPGTVVWKPAVVRKVHKVTRTCSDLLPTSLGRNARLTFGPTHTYS